MTYLRKFDSTLTLDQLADALSAPPEELNLDHPTGLPPSQAMPAELLGSVVGADVVNALGEAADIAVSVDRSDPKKRSPVDAQVIGLIHEPLASLSHQAASDPGFWTWLSCGPGRRFTWARWSEFEPVPTSRGEVDAALNAEGSDIAKRFRMTSASLHGVSRHALARLWWLGDSLSGDYEAAAKMLANQDIFQAVYEREVGLAPGLSETLIEVFSLGSTDLSGTTFRQEIMKPIRQLATVTKVEALKPTDLETFVETVRSERLPDS